MKSDPGSPVAILLVDDNPNGLTARRMILEGQGFTVTGSDNAEDAWALFQKARFDIVVTDYRLKGMNGGDLDPVIRHLRFSRPRSSCYRALSEVLGPQ